MKDGWHPLFDLRRSGCAWRRDKAALLAAREAMGKVPDGILHCIMHMYCTSRCMYCRGRPWCSGESSPLPTRGCVRTSNGELSEGLTDGAGVAGHVLDWDS